MNKIMVKTKRGLIRFNMHVVLRKIYNLFTGLRNKFTVEFESPRYPNVMVIYSISLTCLETGGVILASSLR